MSHDAVLEDKQRGGVGVGEEVLRRLCRTLVLVRGRQRHGLALGEGEGGGRRVHRARRRQILEPREVLVLRCAAEQTELDNRRGGVRAHRWSFPVREVGAARKQYQSVCQTDWY